MQDKSTVPSDRLTRRLRLPNPRPHGLAHTHAQSRHGTNEYQPNQQMHKHLLAFTQIAPPALGVFGFGSAEEGLFVLAF